MKFQKSLLALGLGLLTGASASATTLADLERGQLDIRLIDTSGQDYIQAQGIFDAPIEKVWKTLTDFKNYPRYYQNLTRSEIRSRSGNQAKVYVKFNLPFPVNEIWVLNQYTLDAQNKRLSWKMLDGNLKDSDGVGSWTLKPHKGKTLATYRLNVNPSGGNWLQKQAIFQTTPRVFQYLNQQMGFKN
ncbi:MAG: SRPBCC family protein [Candidatus Sericytochromatia bacterium]|nr:SRPBCC family protein [Candidatus Sericytochromatia bacterium]